MSRYARRKDESHHAIVQALRKAGCSAHSIEGDTAGCPDLLVGKRLSTTGEGVTFLLEVKTGKGHGNKATNAAQAEWHRSWRGKPVAVVRTPAEALAAVGFQVTPDVRVDAAQVNWFGEDE